MPLTKSQLDHYTRSTEKILLNKETEKTKLLGIYELVEEIFSEASKASNQFFSNFFAVSAYIFNLYSFSPQLAKKTTSFRRFAYKVSKEQGKSVNRDELKFATHVITRCLKKLSDGELDSFLEPYLNFEYTFREDENFADDKTNYLKGLTVFGKKSSEVSGGTLKCASDELGNIEISLNGGQSEILSQVWKGCKLNIFNVDIVDNENYKAKNESLFVLEPDYLIDVTDISECFTGKGYNPLAYFLKLFISTDIKLPLVMGNLINEFFDELIINKNYNFDNVLEFSSKKRPLQIIALLFSEPEIGELLRSKLYWQFNNLQNSVQLLEYESVSAEPAFLSPDYGIQGRLDALLEFKDARRKDIIELKSGKAPSPDITYESGNDLRILTGVWPNHLSQVSCYNLLLDSAYPGRTGSSSILYSGAEEHPLRNVPNIVQNKKESLELRNWIVSIAHKIAEGETDVLKSFSLGGFGARPSYMNGNISEFETIYNSLDDIEREYFNTFVTFIQRELFSQKTGNGLNNMGYSALWRGSIGSKRKKYSVLTNLIINFTESDTQNFHLRLESETRLSSSKFRKGDIAILYPSDLENFGELIKCSIKEIRNHYVLISLRNKSFKISALEKHKSWILEPDSSDSTSKTLFASLFEFMTSSKGKRELLLSRRKPKFDIVGPYYNEELFDLQNEAVEYALAAKDYYLIQGPPGTGKTSFVFKTIVSEYLFEKTGNILVMAYTNRAVDELCSALNSAEIDFIRLGYKESSEFKDNMPAYLAESIGLRKLGNRIGNCRIIACTVATALKTPEIFSLKEFDMAIVDEASQILEPYLVGILSRVNKFILIGDHFQLPAIVSQNQDFLEVESEMLKSIGLTNLGSSLFERLIEHAKLYEWDNAFTTLEEQGRMHKEIAAFPSKHFYSGALSAIEEDDIHISENNVISLFGDKNKRVVFIDCPVEDEIFINHSEAKAALSIINKINTALKGALTGETVGIISPFRAQCALINSLIDDEVYKYVNADTVERYQGSQRNIILISFAVNREYDLTKISSAITIEGVEIDRKLNVSLTRAREQLIILGNSGILSKNRIFRELIQHLKAEGLYIQYDELD